MIRVVRYVEPRSGETGVEFIRVLRIVEPRSGETGVEFIRVLRIVESRRDETREDSERIFEVVSTHSFPELTMRHIPYAAVSHLRCGTFSDSFDATIGHNCCVQYYIDKNMDAVIRKPDLSVVARTTSAGDQFPVISQSVSQ